LPPPRCHLLFVESGSFTTSKSAIPMIGIALYYTVLNAH
jgi:hypothetical protein